MPVSVRRRVVTRKAVRKVKTVKSAKSVKATRRNKRMSGGR